MRRTILASLFLAACVAAPASADPIDDAFSPWAGGGGPGCAVGIARDGRAPILRAYGMADLERSVPITVDTVFETGSVAKQFTAAAILMLVEQGRLALDDDIRRYLPEMPDLGHRITIDHLLTHTSGLRDWSDLVDFSGWPRYSRVYSNADALLFASRQRALNHRPGERWSYTNTGYNLLPIIVERVTGRSFADFTRDRIFAPLGMTRSSWRDDYRRIVPGRALGYVREGEAFVLGLPIENAHGSGGMLTTVSDLMKWLEALDRGTLGPFVTAGLTEAARLNDGRTAAYGRGLVLGSFRGQREIFHNGGTNGYQAWAGRYSDQGIAIAMLCNGRTVGPDTQVRRIAGPMLPAEPERPPAPAPGPEELRLRPGLYVGVGPFAILEIVARDGRLQLESGTALDYDAPGRYRFGTSELRFTPDGLERRRPGGEIERYTREPAVGAETAELAALAGDYAGDEVFGRLRLEVRDAALMLSFAGRAGEATRLTPLIRDGYRGPGYLMRIRRGPDGRIAGLRFQTSRVYALDFARRPAATQ